MLLLTKQGSSGLRARALSVIRSCSRNVQTSTAARRGKGSCVDTHHEPRIKCCQESWLGINTGNHNSVSVVGVQETWLLHHQTIKQKPTSTNLVSATWLCQELRRGTILHASNI